MADKDALELFQHYYEPARRHTESLAAQWDSYEKAYHGESEVLQKPSGDDDWKSYILYKHAMQQTHTAVAEIVPEEDPGFDWDSPNQDQKDYNNIVEALIADGFQKDDYSEKKFLSALLACVYGGCPVKVSWETRRERYVRLTPTGPRVEYRIGCDRASASLLDARDFFWDLRAKNLKDARFACHRMRLTIEELDGRERADGTKLYKNLDKLREWFESSAEGAGDTQEWDNDHGGELALARRKGIEVIEMWTHNRIIVRAGGKYIIRDEERVDPIPGLPFTVIKIIPSLNDVWGMSLMQLVRDPQENLWALRNAALNGLKLLMDPPRAVDVMSDPDNADRPWKPGQVYPTSMAAKDAVELLRVQGIDPLVSQNALAAEQEVMEYITGLTRELAGSSDAGTATQAALNQRQAKGRIGKMIATVNRSWCDVAKMFLLLNQVFLDYSKPVKILGARGAEWVQVTPKMIGGDWQPTPKASSVDAMRELTKQNLLEWLSSVLPINGMVSPSGKAVDWAPIVKQLAELNNINPDTVVVDAASLFASQHDQTIANAQSEAEAMQIMQPPDPEAQPENMVEAAQSKLFQSVNYKDLPNQAQAAMLESIGLPSEGVETDDNPTKPTRPEPSILGRSTGQKALAESGGKQ